MKIRFLFFHYGKIPSYLLYAIEQVRNYNPDSEIILISDGIKTSSILNRYNVNNLKISDFNSEKLSDFRKNYKHISCFKEKYERFVLERWFVAEIIRKKNPDYVYIMQDSDVALFGNANSLMPLLPNKPICLSSTNPHFTYIKGTVDGFLNFILDFYHDKERVDAAIERYRYQNNPDQNIFTQGEMQFLFDYIKKGEDMIKYDTNTPYGYVDLNIHIHENFEYMKLRRRPRKKVFWILENGSLSPYFKKGDSFIKVFLLHFQGPGKRVFFRFAGASLLKNRIGVWLLNQIFQNRLIANLS